MKKMSPTVKISFAAGLIFGIGVFLFITVFRSTDSSYVAPAPEPQEEKAIEAPPSLPIVQEVTVSASGAYTMTGEELQNFRAEKRWPVASITKLMTALVASRVFDPNEAVTITQEMIDTEGESGEFRVGEKIRVSDLIKAMMLVSSNDAAAALAIHYGEPAFIKVMNETARNIGMYDTLYKDPTGLSVQNLSTIQDLDKLARYIWTNNPSIFAITREEGDMIFDMNTGLGRRLTNINQFAGRSDFLGGKTGTTPEAEGNLLSIFKAPGREEPVIIIVLGTKDRFKETENILMKL
jgi:D-alanyl-D-alanine carboxypeptidase